MSSELHYTELPLAEFLYHFVEIENVGDVGRLLENLSELFVFFLRIKIENTQLCLGKNDSDWIKGHVEVLSDEGIRGFNKNVCQTVHNFTLLSIFLFVAKELLTFYGTPVLLKLVLSVSNVTVGLDQTSFLRLVSNKTINNLNLLQLYLWLRNDLALLLALGREDRYSWLKLFASWSWNGTAWDSHLWQM